MFVGKAGAYPIEEPFRCSTLGLAPGLADKQKTRLERLARDKHSRLIRKFVNHGQKILITLARGTLGKILSSVSSITCRLIDSHGAT